MTSPGYKLYSLTHEVFYLEIGEQYGCMSGMEVLARAHNRNTVDGLHRRFCADVYRDAVRIYKQGAPDGTQDLFMEQAALCGMLGFRDFARPEWLDGILSWQHRSGCYKIQDYSHIFEDYLTKEVAAANRVKREEAVLAGYCLAHKTTVAAGALSQHIRYLLETLTSA
ncbi:PREDICTED: UPF0764 protein C16orf89 homolog isoform X1 [Priapulus caudatus]|uniref:UPF0764 protein C16orf89 homolog isoform X1 n=1 Tax=Priapulus caudatus TaxID=37621 RepID=A0ABM1DNY3_PRICU|nr:PREDICTED: UPF0764 protein C16orf89 homolog isoform X1 [Priapulus caudatus]